MSVGAGGASGQPPSRDPLRFMIGTGEDDLGPSFTDKATKARTKTKEQTSVELPAHLQNKPHAILKQPIATSAAPTPQTPSVKPVAEQLKAKKKKAAAVRLATFEKMISTTLRKSPERILEDGEFSKIVKKGSREIIQALHKTADKALLSQRIEQFVRCEKLLQTLNVKFAKLTKKTPKSDQAKKREIARVTKIIEALLLQFKEEAALIDKVKKSLSPTIKAFSEAEITATQEQITTLLQNKVSQGPTVKQEMRECAIFVLANCKDLLAQMKNDKLQANAQDKLIKQLLRYTEALKKFPRIIADLNQNLTARMKVTVDLPIEKKQLLIIFGDAFLKHSGLEGDTSTLKYAKLAKDFLEKSQLPLANPKLPAILDEAIDLRAPVDNLAELVQAQIKKNGKCLLLGGWKGHAVSFVVEEDKANQSKLKVTVYNAGDGVQFHPGATAGLKKKFQTSMEITCVDPDLLFKAGWLEQLQLLANVSGRKYSHEPAEILYKQLIPTLGGKISSPDADINSLMTPQRSGTCTWKNLFAFIAKEMGKLPSKQFKFRFKMAALTNYTDYLQKKVATGQEITKDELEGLARATEKMSAGIVKIQTSKTLSSLISAAEITTALAFIEKIEGLITQVQAKNLVKQITEDSRVENLAQLSRDTRLHQKFDQSIELSDVSPEAAPDERGTPPHIPLENQLLSWKPGAQTIAADIKKFEALLKAAKAVGNRKEIVDFFNHFVAKLIRCDPDNSKLWGAVTVEEVKQLMLHLTSISEYAQSALNYIGGIHLCSEINVIANLHILASLQTLATKLPADETLLYTKPDPDGKIMNAMAVPSSPVGLMAGSLFEDTSFRITNNPEHNRYLERLSRQYPQSFAVGLFQKRILRNETLQESKNRSPALYYALQRWLAKKENEQHAKKIIDPLLLLSTRSFDTLSESEKIEAIETNYLAVLPQSFCQLFAQACRLYKSYNLVSNEDEGTIYLSVRIPLNQERMNKTPLSGLNPASCYTQLMFLPTFPPFQNESLELLSHLILSGRKTENTIIEDGELAKKVGLSLEELRNLLSIRSEREFQIPLTIDYFSEHMHTLNERDYQTLFKMFLFEGTVLFDDLKTAPHRVQKIEEFLRRAYALFDNQNDIQTCAFLLQLASSLHDYSNHQIAPWDMNAKIAAAIKKLELLPQSEKRDSELSLLHSTRLAMHSYRLSQEVDKPPQELLVALLQSRHYILQHPLTAEYKDVRQEIAINDTLYYLKGPLEGLVAKQEERDALFNTFISSLKGGAQCNYQWKPDPTYPLFTTQDAAFQFNIETGSILSLKDRSLLQRVPKEFSNSADFRTVFGTREAGFFCNVLTPSLIEIKENGNVFRVRPGAYRRTAYIFRKFGEPPEWALFGYGGGINQVPSSILNDQHEKWVTLAGDKQQKTVYYVDPITKKPRYLLQNQAVHKVEEGTHRASPWLLQSVTKENLGKYAKELESTYALLTNFEKPYLMHLWKNEKTNILELELPRFDLHFECDLTHKNARWICREQPGYFLSSPQTVAALGNLAGSFVLENGQGQKKVLIPNRRIDEVFYQSLNFPVSFSQVSRFENEVKQSYIECTIDPQGALIPRTLIARFHLATIYLAQSRYEEASQLLLPVFTEIPERGYTEEEHAALWSLTHTRQTGGSVDAWGQAVAVRLHAHYLLEKNRQKLGYPENSNAAALESVMEKYRDELELYYNQFNNTGSMRLPDYEEEILIRRYMILSKLHSSIPDIAEAILNRAEELGISTAEFSRGLHSDHIVQSTHANRFLDSSAYSKNYLQSFCQYVEYNFSHFSVKKPLPSALSQPFFSEKEQFDKSFFALYDQVRNVTTEEERRRLFVQLFPISNRSFYRESTNQNIAAGILLVMLFSPQQFPANHQELLASLKKEGYSMVKKLLFVNVRAAQDRGEEWLTTFPISRTKIARVKASPVPGRAKTRAMLTYIENSPESTLSLVPFTDYFTTHLEADSTKAATKKSFDAIFSPSQSEAASEAMVKKFYQNMQKEVAHFLEETSESYQVREERLTGLTSTLQAQLEAETDTLQFQEAEIHFLSSKESADPLIRAEIASGKRTYPTMEELFVYFGQQGWQGLQERNPALTNEDIEKLRTLLTSFLLNKTKAQKIERSLVLAASLKTLPQGDERDEVVQNLALELKAKRAYEVAKYPAFLVFECFSNMLMRQDQLADMKLFLEQGISVARQRIMGAGKTTVLLPLLALLLADGKQTSMMTVPKALLAPVATIFRQVLGAAFREPFCYIHFHRSHLSDKHLKAIGKTRVEYLQELLDKLKNGGRNGVAGIRQVVLMTPEIRHSLINAFEEALAFPNKIDALSRDLLREISQHVKTAAIELVDEIDQALSPRLEFNYALGDKKQYDQKKGKLVARLTQEAGHHPFTLTNYRATKNKLVESLLDKLLQDRHLLGAEEAAANKKILGSLKPQEKEYLQCYLRGTTALKERLTSFRDELHLSEKTIAHAEALLRQDKNATLAELSELTVQNREKLKALLTEKIAFDTAIEEFVKTVPAALRELLATATCVLNTILPTALSRVCNEKFGWRKEPMNLIACPFEAADAPKTSEYATPEEQVVYSLRTLSENGISNELAHYHIKKLHAQAIKQSSIGKIPVEQTAAFKQFDLIRGPNKEISLIQFSEAHLPAIIKQVNKSPELLMLFCDLYLLPKVMVYPSKISSNPYKLASSSKVISGFTGTLEPSILPRGMTPKVEEGTSAKIVVAIQRKVEKGSSHVLRVSETQGPLSGQLLHKLATEDTHLALIDSGGWLKDVKIPEFAKKLLEQSTRPKIRGIVYHDEAGKLISLEKTARGFLILPLEESYLKEEERITLIAQKYCTGTNVKQAATAKALKTTGKHENLRDFLQSVFRMRGILKKQDVDLLISDEIAEAIRDTLGLKKTDSIDYAVLLRFYATSQCYRVADDTLLAMRQKMQSLIQEIIKRELLDPKNEHEYQQIFTKARELFVQAEQTALYPSYATMAGFITREAKIAQMVEAYVTAIAPHLTAKVCLDVIGTGKAAVQSKSLAAKQTLAKEVIRGRLTACVDKEALREVLPAFSYDFGREVEREQEAEAEQETHKETTSELTLEAYGEAGSLKQLLELPWRYANDSGAPDLLKWRENFAIERANCDVIPDENVFSPIQELFTELSKEGTARTNPDLATKYPKVGLALSKQLAFSLNFVGTQEEQDRVRNIEGDLVRQVYFDTFGKTQKNSYQLLVINETGKPARTVLISLKEAVSIKKAICALSNDQKAQLVKDKVSFSIYDPIGGLDIASGTPCDPEKDKALFQQLVQIKFLNGSLHYEPHEADYLRSWLQENDTKELYHFFLNKILAYKSESRRAFLAESFLKMMFEELIG